MARYVIGSNVTVGGVSYYRDQVAELTSATASAITGAGGKVRLLNSPGGTQVTTYPGGGTSTLGVHTASETHDTSGEASGVSNSA
jgi:hypothetical protein